MDQKEQVGLFKLVRRLIGLSKNEARTNDDPVAMEASSPQSNGNIISLADMEKLAAVEPDNTGWGKNLANLHVREGAKKLERHELDDAESHFLKAEQLGLAITRSISLDPSVWHLLEEVYENLARVQCYYWNPTLEYVEHVMEVGSLPTWLLTKSRAEVGRAQWAAYMMKSYVMNARKVWAQQQNSDPCLRRPDGSGRIAVIQQIVDCVLEEQRRDARKRCDDDYFIDGATLYGGQPYNVGFDVEAAVTFAEIAINHVSLEMEHTAYLSHIRQAVMSAKDLFRSNFDDPDGYGLGTFNSIESGISQSVKV